MVRRRLTGNLFLAACITAVLVFATNWLYHHAHGHHDHGVLSAQAASAAVEFDITDDPGAWFKNTAGPIGGTQSLAIVNPGDEVKFGGRSHTVHTVSSLLWPTGADGMPFETDPMKGSVSVVLETPGLYVFVCQVHPYMFAAVINDDPATAGLDLGENITLLTGVTVPTSSDLATRGRESKGVSPSPRKI